MLHRYLTYPFNVVENGRISTSNIDLWIKEMIEQILLTNMGERVNLPEFGCGLQNIVMEPNNPALSSKVKFVVTQSLIRWLGDLINVEQVNTSNSDETLKIEIVYSRKDTAFKESTVVVM